MTTRTKVELGTNVMRALGLVNAGESPSAADLSYVSGRYEDLLAELVDDDLAYWSSDAIPSVIFEPLTQLVALSVGEAFGLPAMVENLEEGRRVLKRRLRRHTSKKSSGVAIEFEDF